MEELAVTATYGSDQEQRDVSALLRQFVWPDHCLRIPLWCNFDAAFGDPAKDLPKVLTVTIEGRKPIIIPDNSPRSYCLRLTPEGPCRCTPEELQRLETISVMIISLPISARRPQVEEFVQNTGFNAHLFNAVDGRHVHLTANSAEYKALRLPFEPDGLYRASWRPWTPGEIGCTLSHYWLYRDCIEQRFPAMWILEDDFILLESEDRIKEILAALPAWDTFDICFFQSATHLGPSHEYPNYEDINAHYYRTKVVDGTFSYLITQRGARRLVEGYVLDNTADGRLAAVFNNNRSVVLASRTLFTAHPDVTGRRGSDIWNLINVK